LLRALRSISSTTKKEKKIRNQNGLRHSNATQKIRKQWSNAFKIANNIYSELEFLNKLLIGGQHTGIFSYSKSEKIHSLGFLSQEITRKCP
jgi:hypothetical protein